MGNKSRWEYSHPNIELIFVNFVSAVKLETADSFEKM